MRRLMDPQPPPTLSCHLLTINRTGKGGGGISWPLYNWSHHRKISCSSWENDKWMDLVLMKGSTQGLMGSPSPVAPLSGFQGPLELRFPRIPSI